MDIIFKNKRFGNLVNDENRLYRKYGQQRAYKILLRLSELSVATTLEDVRHLPGNYHELKHNRKGQWSCELDQPYRLIFEPQEDPIPQDEHGKYIWIEIKAIEIIEITNYHKEK